MEISMTNQGELQTTRRCSKAHQQGSVKITRRIMEVICNITVAVHEVMDQKRFARMEKEVYWLLKFLWSRRQGLNTLITQASVDIKLTMIF